MKTKKTYLKTTYLRLTTAFLLFLFAIAAASSCGGGGGGGGGGGDNNPGGGGGNAPDITVTDSAAPDNDLQVLFGDKAVNTTTDHIVTITNNGTADLVIGVIASADPLAAPFSITVNNCSNQPIAPNGNCTLTVRFAPTSTGASSDSFDIPSNDPDENPVTVSLSGTGLAPDITVTDSAAPDNDLQVLFGNVTVNYTSDQTVTITNNGTANLTISSIGVTDPLAAPFIITANTCIQPILPGGSCTVTVRFAPTAVNSYSDSFDIQSNDPDENPVTVSVSGAGVAALVPDIAVTDSVAPNTDLQIPFGRLTGGATATVTISNVGSANLTIGTIASANPLAAPFTITTNNCPISPQSLAPSGSCTVTVQFAPTADGTFTDSFDIPSDDPDENPITVTVSGTRDTTPPTVSDTFPLDGVAGVPRFVNITATFSESMNSSTLTTSTFTLVDSLGNPVAGAVSYSTTNNRATFNPTGLLTFCEGYTATITTGAADLAGNPLAADYFWSFTVIGPPIDPNCLGL